MASDDTRSIDLNGTTAGSISQTFTTVPGTTYRVTFDLSGNPDSAAVGNSLYSPAEKTLTVSVNGGSQAQSYSYNTSVAGNTKTNMMYATETCTFVATSTTTITFASTTSGAFGPELDNVRIEETGVFVVCHRNNGKGENGQFKTLYVDSADSVTAHTTHHEGDYVGSCTTSGS